MNEALMVYEYILIAIGGIGLYIYALRMYTYGLDESFTTRLNYIIAKNERSRLLSFFIGLGVTCILQGSSIALVSIMGLVGRSVLPLTTALFYMFGATVGTTLKLWIFSYNLTWIGPLLVMVASAFFLFVKKRKSKKIVDLVFSLGLIFFAWLLIDIGVSHLAAEKSFMGLLGGFYPENALGIFLACLTGIIVTAFLQSSSTFNFIIFALVGQSALSFLIASAMILGANIGTTFITYLISREHGSDAKRLALAHIVSKSLGVLVVILLFRSFLNVIDYVTTLLGLSPDSILRLAAVHTGFNLFNVIVWSMMPSLLLKLTNYFVKDEKRSRIKLSQESLKLVALFPGHGLEEIDELWRELVIKVKAYEEFAFQKIEIKGTRLPLWSVSEMKNEVKKFRHILSQIPYASETYLQIQMILSRVGPLEGMIDNILRFSYECDFLTKKQKRELKEYFDATLGPIGQERKDLWAGVFELFYIPTHPKEVDHLKHYQKSQFMELGQKLLDNHSQFVLERKKENSQVAIFYAHYTMQVKLLEDLGLLQRPFKVNPL
jgi:Na/Pi-cotransporter